MNRLLKAEWHRMTTTTRFWIFMVIMVIFEILMPFIASPRNAGEYLIGCAEESSYFIFLFVANASAALVGSTYSNRTIYYEVMCGNKVISILTSKCLIIGLTISIIMTIGFAVATLIFGITKGYGELDYIAGRLVLYFLVLFHAALMGTLMVTSFRSMIGAVLCYMRIMIFDGVIPGIIEVIYEGHENKIYDITKWFVMPQSSYVFEQKFDYKLVSAVIISLVAETLFWGIISYVLMKKRQYK